ncbi:MAG: hypothetical protein EPN98_21415 [Phenylobacterium sp.]|uniref:hypothetical protein n=1 Tax=Phenylobacterium sp. TaxID=1871053 RepID=UPI00122716CC|nr:hypothetical protein [Phenylobacterium sp.]TAL29004.1 MAG: hypothetical protein EPN98_21415 [Phenylobacterium sp.]
MVNDFPMTQGDLLPLIDQVLLNGDDSVRDLTNCTVTFRFRMYGDDPSLATERSATIVGAPTDGHVRYSWQPGDTDRTPLMLAEWVVYFPGTLPETFPNGRSDEFPSGYIRVAIKPKL